MLYHDLSDIPNEFDLTITAEDIANGERVSCTHCPVALAVRRKFGDGFSIEAGVDFIHVRSRDVADEGLLMYRGLDGFPTAFDGGRDVQPTTLHLKRWNG